MKTKERQRAETNPLVVQSFDEPPTATDRYTEQNLTQQYLFNTCIGLKWDQAGALAKDLCQVPGGKRYRVTTSEDTVLAVAQCGGEDIFQAEVPKKLSRFLGRQAIGWPDYAVVLNNYAVDWNTQHTMSTEVFGALLSKIKGDFPDAKRLIAHIDQCTQLCSNDTLSLLLAMDRKAKIRRDIGEILFGYESRPWMRVSAKLPRNEHKVA